MNSPAVTESLADRENNGINEIKAAGIRYQGETGKRYDSGPKRFVNRRDH